MLEQILSDFRFHGISKCTGEDSQLHSRRCCEPCRNQKRCVHLTGIGRLFKELTEVQIMSICNYFSQVFTSTAVQARDSSIEQTTPSHGAESCALIPAGDLGAVSTAGESEALTEHLRHVVYERLKHSMRQFFGQDVPKTDMRLKEIAEKDSESLEWVLTCWRERDLCPSPGFLKFVYSSASASQG